MTIKELLPQQVVTADVHTALPDLARKMRDHEVGIVPVLEGDRLVGVATDRDVVVRGIAAIDDCRYLTARSVMTPHPITILEDADTEDAAVLMRMHRLHRLVVVRRGGSVCGVISLTDLSIVGADAFEVLRRLSERPMIDQFPEEDVQMPGALVEQGTIGLV